MNEQQMTEDQKKAMMLEADVKLCLGLVQVMLPAMIAKAGENETVIETMKKCFEAAKEGVSQRNVVVKKYADHHFGKEQRIIT